jgi:hypothetical protein
LLASAATPALAQLSTPFMKPEETEALGNGLYVFRQGAYRSIFLVSEAGVIATDPVSPVFAKAYRAAIAQVTPAPVRYVVYSQSQWDRTGGGQIFKDEGAKFVAHEQCLVNLQQVPHPTVIMPEITYSGYHRVSVGEQALDLYYFGPSHDTCLSVMVAKPANVMFITNIVQPPDAAVPWNPTLANEHLHNYLPFFRAAEDLARREGIETLVGGFIAFGIGPDKKPFLYPAAGPISTLADQRIFWEKVMKAVKEALEAGVPPKQLARRIDMTQFSAYPLYNPRSMQIVFRRVASLYITGR